MGTPAIAPAVVAAGGAAKNAAAVEGGRVRYADLREGGSEIGAALWGGLCGGAGGGAQCDDGERLAGNGAGYP